MSCCQRVCVDCRRCYPVATLIYRYCAVNNVCVVMLCHVICLVVYVVVVYAAVVVGVIGFDTRVDVYVRYVVAVVLLVRLLTLVLLLFVVWGFAFVCCCLML